MFCSNCGAFVEDGASFCPRCGTKFQDQPDKTVVRPVAPEVQQPVYQQPQQPTPQPAYQPQPAPQPTYQPQQVAYQQPVQQPARTSAAAGISIGTIVALVGAVAVIAAMFLSWVEVPFLQFYSQALANDLAYMGLSPDAIPSSISIMGLNTLADNLGVIVNYGVMAGVSASELAAVSTAVTGLRVIFYVGIVTMVVVGLGAVLMVLRKGNVAASIGFVLAALMGLACVGVVSFVEQYVIEESGATAADLAQIGGHVVTPGIGAWVAIAAAVISLVCMVVLKPKAN